jgi:hypothetical protein
VLKGLGRERGAENSTINNLGYKVEEEGDCGRASVTELLLVQ